MGLQSVVKKMWHLKLFIMLKCLVDLSSAQAPGLERICAVDCEGSSIESLPDVCTAIASYSNNTQTNPEIIISLRGDLPYVYIVNDYTYEELIVLIKADKVEEFLTTICQLIEDNNVTALVIDNIFVEVGQVQEPSLEEADFIEFLKKLKERNPEVLIALAVTKNTEILNACVLDAVKLNDLVDFYLVKAHSYRECLYENDQLAMAATSPVDLMNKTLELLETLNFNLTKAVLVIDIRVVFSESVDSKVDASYSELCLQKPDPNIRYCGETLENFYKKGLLVSEYEMAGLLLRSPDRDDYNDSCKCGLYPATTVIDMGANGEPEPAEKICCNTFAVFSNVTQ